MGFDKCTAFRLTAKNKIGWLVVLFLLNHSISHGQSTHKYLVLLRDKANSPYSITRPEAFLSQRSILRRQKQHISITERDLPVNPSYISQLQQAGGKIWFPSRWLNAVMVEATDAVMATIQQLPFVKGLEFGRSLANFRVGADSTGKTVNKFEKAEGIQALNYGASAYQLSQIGVDQMHDQGYHGEGMLIGVLDAGFLNANKVSYLKPLFDDKRVLATYDFVQKETSVYEDDQHGVEVLSLLAATVDNQLYGTAYKASYILLRTEDAIPESRVEEANWLFGAEYADSAGVDIISSSLGYTTFDDASTNYTYQDMDGKTALCTRAAQIATETGMVVVVAAGNEGNDTWHYLTAPSDAASVLAIGAVTQAGVQTYFSSFGPSADGRIKPDLAARGQGNILGSPSGAITSGQGTSFATPLVAGLAAGFWQAHPYLTAQQVTESLRRSGNQYDKPDDKLGYGIPNFGRAATYSDVYSQLLFYPNPFSEANPLVVQWAELGTSASLDATLIDLTGRVIWHTNYPPGGIPNFVLPNLNLSAGMYLMTLISGNKKRTLKVVKQ
ncbi:S8 family serine peptidase [Spirosoma sp. SC4-14]|uniref:S8 family serine peptidase n=1 Tax=Spirosoma sp. SC4-14 TaxID=3128900 RepID=UPI0030D026D1